MTTPYAGNPANFPASIPVPVSSDAPTATLFTTAYEGLADRTAYLNARIGPIAALNWHEVVHGVVPVSGGGGAAAFGQNVVFWDFDLLVWIVPFIDGNFPTVDGGVPLSNTGFDERSDEWWQLGGTAGPTYGPLNNNDFLGAMGKAANGAYLTAIVAPGAARTQIVSMTPSGGSPTTVLGFPGVTTFTSCNIVGNFAGAIVAGFGSSDAAHTTIWYNVDGTGSTWATQAVGTVIGAGAPELIVKGGIVNGSAGFIVIPILAAVSETGTTFAYFTSNNGSTWTQRSLSGVIASTETPIGLDFGADANGACWILATQAGATSTSNYYRSADGINWTFIASTTTRAVQDLSCVGTLWLATVFDATAGSPIFGTTANPIYGAAGASYTVFSIDGANTWHRSRGGVLSKNLAIGNSRQQRAKIARNNEQFCMYNSLQLRFSDSILPSYTFA